MYQLQTRCRALYENTRTTVEAYLRDTVSLRFVYWAFFCIYLLKAVTFFIWIWVSRLQFAFLYHLFWKRTFGISTISFCMDVHPVNQPTVTKLWGKYKSLTPTSYLALSFLYPAPDSQWKGVCLMSVSLKSLNSFYYRLPKSQLCHLQQIQNSFAHAVVKAPKSCHITSILCCLHLPYLHNFISIQHPHSTRSLSVVTLAQTLLSSSKNNSLLLSLRFTWSVESTPFTSFWYQFLCFQLTYTFTHYFCFFRHSAHR